MLTATPRTYKGSFWLRALQTGIWAVGVACLVWAFTAPDLRDPDGSLATRFCLVAALGVAIIILGWAVVGQWKAFAFWLALAIVGQAVALQLVEAGPYVRYQHYRPFDRLLTGVHPLVLALIALQAGLVVAGVRARWSSIRAWLGQTFSRWQLLGIGLVFSLSSATVSRDISNYLTELVLATVIQAVNLMNITLVVWTLPAISLSWPWRGGGRPLGRSRCQAFWATWGLDRFAMLAAIWVAILAAGLSVFAYERHPHLADEVAYLYQARILAHGSLTLTAPSVPDAFDLYLMQLDGERWYPAPPVGWPALLALGVLVDAPWMVNPVLTGLNLLLAYLVLQALYDRWTARVVVLLLCVSPWHLFMGMSFMTHTFTLTCGLVAALAVIRAGKGGQQAWGWLAGIAVGLGSLIRPLDGFIVGALVGLYAIGVGGPRLKTRSLVAFALGAAVSGAIVFPYNQVLTGDPFVHPIMVHTDQRFGPGSNAYGFGPERGMGWPVDPFPGHGPIDALINANLNTFSINIDLYGWSTGSLLLIAIAIFTRSIRPADYAMLAVIGTVFTGYFFYYFSGGPDFGARYWYLMLLPCMALTARGIQFLERSLNHGRASPNREGGRVMAAVLLLGAMSLLNFMPWRALDKYHHYLGMRPDVLTLAREHDFGRSLVLIRGEEIPDYASAAIYNPLDLRADAPVYAWDRSSETRSRVLAAYSDWPVWIVDGPTVSGDTFRVSAGPLSARELLAATEQTMPHQTTIGSAWPRVELPREDP